MNDGMIRIAVANPEIQLANPEENARIFADVAKEAASSGAEILLFSRLSLTGATLGDLYKQNVLISETVSALLSYAKALENEDIVSVVGVPLAESGKIYDCAAVVSRGEIIGIAGACSRGGAFAEFGDDIDAVTIGQRKVPVLKNGVFDFDGLSVSIAVGEGSPLAKSDLGLILGSMPETVSTEREICGLMKRACITGAPAVAYAGAGAGESGTDFVFGGRSMVFVGGEAVAVNQPFSDAKLLIADCPMCVIFGGDENFEEMPEFAFSENGEVSVIPPKSPFIPEDENERGRVCEIALEIQSRALAKRIERSYSKKVILGISGGLDSTLAILVAARAMDILGKPHSDIISVTMPCFGTSKRTRGNAEIISEALGTDFRTVDIKAAVNQHFIDIGHSADNMNVVFENSQARERTQILMDMANAESALVIGTGDLSELALGFATYNGDHMSMFSVNGSIPKTLMRAMVRHFAKVYAERGDKVISDVLYDIVNTPVSPELLPTDEAGDIAQCTEGIVGPYELHDFFIYYIVKYGLSPKEILKLCAASFKDVYDEATVKGWLRVFIKKFFAQQFKRSCMPDGVKVTEISLSPRGSFAMPSDMKCTLWLKELD